MVAPGNLPGVYRGRGGLFAALAAAALLVVLSVAPVARGAAIAYQADSAHSGFVANGPNPPLGRKWVRRDLGVRVSYPVIAEGKVFVTAYAGQGSSPYASSAPTGPTFLHALDRNTGATVWTRQVATGGLPAYGEGRVYVLGQEALDAVSAATGERLWRTEMRGAADGAGGGAAPLADGAFVYASDGNSAYAVSADTGLVVQSRSGGGSSFTVVGDRVYLTRSGCNTIALYTRGLAQQVWSRSGPCSSSSAVPAAYHSLNTTPPNERLWARDSKGQTGLVVDALTSLGTEQFTSAGGLALAGELAFLRQAGAVQARNQASGVVAWTAAPATQLRGSALAVRDAVWVTTGAGDLVALRRGDGGELFRTTLLPGHEITSSDHDTDTSFAHAGMAADEAGLLVPFVNRLVALAPGGDAPGVDDPDKIPAGTTQLTASMKPRDLEFGRKVKVAGSVTTSGSGSSSSGSDPPGHQLELQADGYPYDGVWETVDRGSRPTYGNYALDHMPDRNTRYRVVDTSTAPAVISKTIQAYVYPRLRFSLGGRSPSRLRVSAAIEAPEYLALHGKPLHVYRGRKRRGRYTRISSIKIKRVRGTSYRARRTIRVPSGRRTDFFFVCFKIRDTRALTRANGRADPCGRSRL